MEIDLSAMSMPPGTRLCSLLDAIAADLDSKGSRALNWSNMRGACQVLSIELAADNRS
jgi:hypothetical protein